MQSPLPGQQSRRERQTASRNVPRRLQCPQSLSPCHRSMQLQKLGMLSSACPFTYLSLSPAPTHQVIRSMRGQSMPASQGRHLPAGLLKPLVPDACPGF